MSRIADGGGALLVLGLVWAISLPIAGFATTYSLVALSIASIGLLAIAVSQGDDE